MTQEQFAEVLKCVRREKKLTMLDAAELTGIALPIYKMIESGRLYPDREKLRALCEAFGLVPPNGESCGVSPQHS